MINYRNTWWLRTAIYLFTILWGRNSQRTPLAICLCSPEIRWDSRDYGVYFQGGFFTHQCQSFSTWPLYMAWASHCMDIHLSKVILLPHWFSSQGQREDPARLVNVLPKTWTMSLLSYLLDKAVIKPTQTQGERKQILPTVGGTTSTRRIWEIL